MSPLPPIVRERGYNIQDTSVEPFEDGLGPSLVHQPQRTRGGRRTCEESPKRNLLKGLKNPKFKKDEKSCCISEEEPIIRGRPWATFSVQTILVHPSLCPSPVFGAVLPQARSAFKKKSGLETEIDPFYTIQMHRRWLNTDLKSDQMLQLRGTVLVDMCLSQQ